MLEAQSNIKQINETRPSDGQEKVSKPDDDPHLMGEAKTAMDDVLHMNDNSCDNISLEDRVAMVNADQRPIFEHVKSTCNCMKPTNVTVTSNRSESLSTALATLVSRL